MYVPARKRGTVNYLLWHIFWNMACSPNHVPYLVIVHSRAPYSPSSNKKMNALCLEVMVRLNTMLKKERHE